MASGVGARRVESNAGKPVVSFLVGGMQKAGTTALDAYLRQHPGLCMPNTRKELHFFDDVDFDPGPGSLDAYHANFAGSPGQLHGETTPIYAYWNSAPERIRDYNPAMKWILLLRNPVERAYSHWRMERARGVEPLSFESALQEEPCRSERVAPLQERRYSYLDRGRYAFQLRRLFKLFGRSNCAIFLTEDLQTDTRRTLDGIHDFLGVARLPVAPIPFDSLAGTAPPLDEGLRSRLTAFFAEDVLEVEELIGRALGHWLKGDAA